MRQLLRFLYIKEILPGDYSSAVPTVKCRKTVPSVYGKDEIEAMLNSFNRASAVGTRNYAKKSICLRVIVITTWKIK